MTQAITLPPSPAPTRSDPANFAARADAYHTWLVPAIAEMNAQNVENNAQATAAAASALGASNSEASANLHKQDAEAAALNANNANAAAQAAKTVASDKALEVVASASAAAASAAAAAADKVSASASATSAGTAAAAAATTLISAVTQRPKIKPSISIDWTLKPTAAALAAQGWTISRAGSVTSVGPNKIKAAENLLTYSRDFGNVAWTKTNLVTLGAVTFAGLSGVSVVAAVGASTDYHTLRNYITNSAVQATTPYLVRFLVKASAYTKCTVADQSHGTFAARFDLTGAGAVISTGGIGTSITAAIAVSDLDPALYWVSVTFTSIATYTGGMSCGVVGYPDSGATQTNNGVYYTGDGTSGIEVYAAQLQQGIDSHFVETTADPVTVWGNQLVTTAANELAYAHDSNGNVQGLVCEPAATNLILQSETLTNASWNSNGQIGISLTKRLYQGVSPFFRMKKLTTTSSQGIANIFAATATTYTYTVALLGDIWSQCTSCSVGVRDSTNASWGTGVSATVLSGPGSVSGSSYINVTGLSYTEPTLVRVTSTMGAGCTSAGAYIYPSSTTETTIGKAILATRVQVEAGVRNTAYIPTTTAQVTRPVQTVELSGSAGATAINSEQGAMYLETLLPDAIYDVSRVLVQLQKTGNTNGYRHFIGNNGATSNLYTYTADKGVSQAVITGPSSVFASNTLAYAAYSWQRNLFQGAANGTLQTADTSGTCPEVDTLAVMPTSSGTRAVIGKTHLYKSALTSAELAAITTPGVLA